MNIDGSEHYPPITVATSVNIPEAEVIKRAGTGEFPGKKTPTGYWFSANHISAIRAIVHPNKDVKNTTSVQNTATISAEEAAERTGYKASTLRTYVDAHKIEGQFIDHKLFFTEEQVKKIEEMKKKPEKSSTDIQNPSLKPGLHETQESVKKSRVRSYPRGKTVELPNELKREYECAKRIAKARDEPVIVYLLKQAKSDIDKKKELIKTLRE
jgi:hypothetical protein